MRRCVLLIVLAAAGCSSNGTDSRDSGAGSDAWGVDLYFDGPVADQGLQPDQAVDSAAELDGGGLPTFVEQEPNGGATATEFNSVNVPVEISGAIGAANDADIFAFDGTAGQRLTVTVTRTGGDLQPHVAIFGLAPLDVPAVVNAGAGPTVMAEVYLLDSGTYLLGIQDRRNAGDSPAGVGGPTLTYTARIEPLTRAPIVATVGGEVTGDLAPSGTVRVLSFNAAKDDKLELSVIAAQLPSPSQVDTRLSLFHPGQKVWLGTNDNPSLSQSDSLLTGTMPFAGPYHAIVENVELGATDLRFSFKIAKTN